jgi:hypothetical protein
MLTFLVHSTPKLIVNTPNESTQSQFEMNHQQPYMRSRLGVGWMRDTFVYNIIPSLSLYAQE